MWLGTFNEIKLKQDEIIMERPPDEEIDRVLVVDDNTDMRSYIVKLLRKFYKVDEAGDGLEALEKISQNVPDLVLTDVMMPRMDGKELLKKLRSDEKFSTLPVVFLSARAGEETKVEGLYMGADDYLVKPFTGNVTKNDFQ